MDRDGRAGVGLHCVRVLIVDLMGQFVVGVIATLLS